MNFIGEKCVFCGKTFNENDDIVVCPECGSPHHRDCYMKEKHCANYQIHGTNEKWKKSEPEEKTEFQKSAFEESQSNFNYYNEQTYQEKVNNIGLNLNEDIGGATLQEITMFVKINTLYYIPIFKKMKELGSKISFNFSCFIFPSYYFANRKMWLWAIISTIISVIFNIPASIMIMAEQGIFTDGIMNVIYQNHNLIEQLESLCTLGSWISRILMCIFANWIYFKFTIKKINTIKKSTNGKLNSHMIIAFGGVKPTNIILISLITMSLSLVTMIATTMFLNFLAI